MIKLHGAWAVPDFSRPGDTFTMTLPDELDWAGSAFFTLLDTDNQAMATARVTQQPDGRQLVTFTLTGLVLVKPLNVHGEFDFWTSWDAAAAADLDPKTTQVLIASSTTSDAIPIEVTVPSPPPPAPSRDPGTGTGGAGTVPLPSGLGGDGAMRIHKVSVTTRNTITEAALGGAVFAIYDVDPRLNPDAVPVVPATRPTSGFNHALGFIEGDAVVIELPAGAYWVVEISAPKGYLLDPTPHEVTIGPADTAEDPAVLTVADSAAPVTSLIKTINAGADAEQDGNVIGAAYTYRPQGWAWGSEPIRYVRFEHLIAPPTPAAGQFTLVDAPSPGLNLDCQVIMGQVNGASALGMAQPIVEVRAGSVDLLGADQRATVPDPRFSYEAPFNNNGAAYYYDYTAGAYYDFTTSAWIAAADYTADPSAYRARDLAPVPVDDDGAWTWSNLDEQGKQFAITCDTNTNELTVTWPDLPAGYVASLSGIATWEDPTFTGVEYVNNATATLSTQHGQGASESTRAPVVNYNVSGNASGDYLAHAFTITKTAAGDSSHLLAGAEFDVWDYLSHKIGHIVTGPDGTASFADSCDPEAVGYDPDNANARLRNPTYILIETRAPDGYEPLGRPVPITVFSGAPLEVPLQAVANKATAGGFGLTKVAAGTTTPLAGAIFTVYTGDDTPDLAQPVMVPGEPVDGMATLVPLTLSTDASGQASSPALSAGSYWLVETTPPAGYLSADPIKLTLDTDGFHVQGQQPGALRIEDVPAPAETPSDAPSDSPTPVRAPTPMDTRTPKVTASRTDTLTPSGTPPVPPTPSATPTAPGGGTGASGPSVGTGGSLAERGAGDVGWLIGGGAIALLLAGAGTLWQATRIRAKRRRAAGTGGLP